MAEDPGGFLMPPLHSRPIAPVPSCRLLEDDPPTPFECRRRARSCDPGREPRARRTFVARSPGPSPPAAPSPYRCRPGPLSRPFRTNHSPGLFPPSPAPGRPVQPLFRSPGRTHVPKGAEIPPGDRSGAPSGASLPHAPRPSMPSRRAPARQPAPAPGGPPIPGSRPPRPPQRARSTSRTSRSCRGTRARPGRRRARTPSARSWSTFSAPSASSCRTRGRCPWCTGSASSRSA